MQRIFLFFPDFGEVDIIRLQHSVGEQLSPDLLAAADDRQRKFDNCLHAPCKSLIEVLPKVYCQNRYTIVCFHELQQAADLDEGVTVVCILNLR